MSKPLKIAISIFATLVFGFLGFIMFVAHSISSDKTTDRTADWSRFYADNVSGYFRLPNELQIVKAEYTETGIMGDRFLIRFRLPETKKPEVWLKEIAKKSKFLPRYRISPYVYDCADTCDLLKIEYVPREKIYEAQGGWD